VELVHDVQDDKLGTFHLRQADGFAKPPFRGRAAVHRGQDPAVCAHCRGRAARFTPPQRAERTRAPPVSRSMAATIIAAVDGSAAALQAARLLAGYRGDPQRVALSALNVQPRPLTLWPGPAIDARKVDDALLA